MSDQVETLAYAGEVPWHRKGNVLTGRVTAPELLIASGLAWTVEGSPVIVEGNAVAGVKALVRRPHGNVLAPCVSEDYGIVQNDELAMLCEAMAGQGVKAWEVGGSLDEGKRVFFCGVLADREIAGDLVRDYLTVASSHDQSLSVTGGFSPIRVVCANTLGAFLADGSSPRIVIRHTKSASEKVKLAAKLCAQARAYFGQFNVEALSMVGAAMSVVEAVELSETLFPKYKSDSTGEVVTPALQTTCIELFKNMHCVPADKRIAGTRWGFYQALTACLDHNRKGGDKGKLARFLSGSDDSIRSRAWKFLTGK
jgi:phage/plasmid-like protein (TIGR03299 family)